MGKLKNCPFCGTDHRYLTSQMVGSDYFVILCKNCFCKGPLSDTEEDAIYAWNNRLPNNTVEDRQAKLLVCPLCCGSYLSTENCQCGYKPPAI